MFDMALLWSILPKTQKEFILKVSHSVAHYLMTIHDLRESRGYARMTDIASTLGLTKGSVSSSINKLKKKGLIEEQEGSKFLLLTEIAHDEVHRILANRKLLFYLFSNILDVDDESAIEDACDMEHLLSDSTTKAIFNFLKNSNISNLEDVSSVDEFILGQNSALEKGVL